MNIKQANEIPAGLWLERMEGIRPSKTCSGGDEVFYHSPLRNNDTNPSFVWSRSKNLWIDNGTGEGGRTFELVKRLRNLVARDALDLIQKSGLYTQDYIPCAPITQKHYKTSSRGLKSSLRGSMKLVSAQAIQSPALLAYLGDRKISMKVAQKYFKEVHYLTTNGATLFAVGLESSSGGYATSSKLKSGKGYVGENLSFSHLNKHASQEILVFEGLIDAGSFISKYPKYENHPILVLNSTNLVKKALPELQAYESVQIWCDADTAGSKATQQLLEALPAARDMRKHLFPWNDVNAWICEADYLR